MNLDVDFLINFFDKFSGNSQKEEMDEQDAGAAPSTPPTGGSGKAVPKWAETYTIKRGKGNMLGLKGEKWETGLTRGAGNKIW